LDLNKIIDFKFKFNPEDFANDKKHETLVNHPYPCIQKLVRDRAYWEKHNPKKTFEPAHIVRFSYIIEELNKGKSEEEILKEIEKIGWDDYKEDKTIYQISQIKGTRYIHPSCETLKNLGYCIKDCNHFDWLLQKYVKKEKR
jgi:DNA primase large subunit